MKDLKLVCTGCNKEYLITDIITRCDECYEPLQVEEVKLGSINNNSVLNQSILDRYQDFLPFRTVDNSVSLGEGFTSLIDSVNIANQIGVKKLYFKNETSNPTWSFKDRGSLVGVLHATRLGVKKIGTVSTGNMAPSVAAYGAKANLKTTILVNGTIADEKLNPIAIYKPKLLKVIGEYSKLYDESLKIGREKGIYFINSDVPMRVEGSKTIAFEICEQLKFEVPDFIVVPTSAGGNLRGIIKGFKEFLNSGLISKLPTFVCAQSVGCSPIYEAYKNNRLVVSKFGKTNTIAHAIENPFPPSGNEILRLLKKYKGIAVAVTNSEIVAAQARMAQDGVFGQPASAVALAATVSLRNSNLIADNSSVVCVVTGSGLKYTAAFTEHELEYSTCDIADLRKKI